MIIQIPKIVSPALILDLDGTIRYSKSGRFIDGPDDIALFDGVEEKILEFRDNGFLILGATNQGGVAYGLKTNEQNIRELNATIALFERNPFHAIKSAYHHPGGSVEPYCHRSLTRKPDIGLLVLLEEDAFESGYIIDWDNSLMVGDREEDRRCAVNAKIAFAWAWSFFDRPQPEGI